MMSEREKELGAIEARGNALKTAPSVFDLEIRRLENLPSSKREGSR